MISGVIKILKDDATIQSLVGLNASGDKYKVYPGTCPQPEHPPFIVVRRTGKSAIPCKGSRPTVYTHTFEVIAYHKSYDKLDDIENAIELALDQQSGPYEGVTFKHIFLQNAFDSEYITDWSLHARVVEFEAMVVNANTAT